MKRAVTIAHIVWLEVIRRKDVYVLLILLGALLVTLISLNVFGLGGVAMYALDVGLLMAWAFSWILAVMVSTRQLPREETRGTVYPLLAKPVTRLELVLGKWLGAWSVVGAATAVFYVLVTTVVALKGARPNLTALLQGYILQLAATGIIAAVGLLCSTRLNYDAAASLTFVLTGASFLVVPRIPEFVTQATSFGAGALLTLYSLLPHFEVFDLRQRIVHAYGPVAWSVAGMILAYGVFWIALCLLGAWLAYRHKRFSRGTQE